MNDRKRPKALTRAQERARYMSAVTGLPEAVLEQAQGATVPTDVESPTQTRRYASAVAIKVCEEAMVDGNGSLAIKAVSELTRITGGRADIKPGVTVEVNANLVDHPAARPVLVEVWAFLNERHPVVADELEAHLRSKFGGAR